MSTQAKFLDLNKYLIGALIGEGSYGYVYQIKNKQTKEYFAAKISKIMVEEQQRDDEQTLFLFREINLISLLNHPSILKFIGYSPNNFEGDPLPTIITEFSTNGSLKNIIQMEYSGLAHTNWDFTKKLICIYGIASGMSYLHSHNIIHRDLKPDNVLMDDHLHPKIADFGLSKITDILSISMDIQSAKGLKGTPIYMAPEALGQEIYKKEGDVYSFAMLIYNLLCGEIPIEKVPILILIKIITVDGYRPPIKDDIPDIYRQLIETCWDQEPEKRLTFDQIVDQLRSNDEFITSDVDKDEFEDYVDYIDAYKTTFDVSKKLLHFEEFIKSSRRCKKKKSFIENIIDSDSDSDSEMVSIELENKVKLENIEVKKLTNFLQKQQKVDTDFTPSRIVEQPFTPLKPIPNQQLIPLNEILSQLNDKPFIPLETNKIPTQSLIPAQIKQNELQIQSIKSDEIQQKESIDKPIQFLKPVQIQGFPQVKPAQIPQIKQEKQNELQIQSIKSDEIQQKESIDKSIKFLKPVQIQGFPHIKQEKNNEKLTQSLDHNEIQQNEESNEKDFKSTEPQKIIEVSDQPQKIQETLFNADHPQQKQIQDQFTFDKEPQETKLPDLSETKKQEEEEKNEEEEEKNEEEEEEEEEGKKWYKWIEESNEEKDTIDKDKLLFYSLLDFKLLDKSNQKLVIEAYLDPEKQFLVARNLIKGENNFPVDINLGLKYLYESMKGNCMNAIIFCINMLIKGNIYPQDLKKAKKLIHQNFHSRDVRSFVLLGKISKQKKHYSNAKKYFEKGVNKGDSECIYQYAKMLFNGVGENKNISEAFKYFFILKNKGHQKSQFFLTAYQKLNTIEGFKQLPLETQSFLILSFVKSCMKFEKIIIPADKTEALFLNNSLQSIPFLNCLQNFQNIIIIIEFPSKTYNPIFDLVNKIKKNKLHNILIEIYLTSFDQVETTFESVTISKQIKEIKGNFFNKSKRLSKITIPFSITSISKNAFIECESLKQIILPQSLTSIKKKSFANCESLEKISLPSSLTYIGKKAFYQCKSLKQIKIPLSVTSIEVGAFSLCFSLKTIEIPSSVTSIGKNAFYQCESLKQIKIPPSIKVIKESMFYGCKSLNIVEIPDSIISIEKNAFYQCSSLKIEMPKYLESIGEYAFYDCKILNFTQIPTSVTSIGNHAFANCLLFSMKIFNGRILSFEEYVFANNQIRSIEIPSSVTSIKNNAFLNCLFLSEVIFQENSSLNSIGESAFQGCALKKIDIPSSVTEIGNNAFYGCERLYCAIIDKNLKSIGIGAFPFTTAVVYRGEDIQF